MRNASRLAVSALFGTALALPTTAQEAIGRLPGRAATDHGQPARPGQAQNPEVPLQQWTSLTFPSGLTFGNSNGISWGDYDMDGWVDVFVGQDAVLWRNLGGTDWQLAADFDAGATPLIPTSQQRYGAAFADYDNDGLPDIAIEPRNWVQGDTCFRLLRNLGDGNFEQVAGTGVIPSRCLLPSETICWADVDVDGDLDLLIPTYPAWRTPPGPGNLFYENLGPVGPGGEYQFADLSTTVGTANPAGTSRPEGAQFCDFDHDGDLDFFANGTAYLNTSTTGVPSFAALAEGESGIGFATSLDEGTAFFDYDFDGDYDLFVVYNDEGVVLWENLGDGTFFAGESGIIESPMTGLALGMSAEDWDNDGDIDFSTRQVFRRNQWMETGQRNFTVATHTIPANHITRATPAWADWDRDGDLDCALGNWLSTANFYENTLYESTASVEDRRYVRVRPVADDPAQPLGLDTEFGATVEVRVVGESFRRKKFTSTSNGYLNQNEYALHFGLPADPVPGNPKLDLSFDVSVDFPSLDGAIVRVDKHVNPALGSIPLGRLFDREIRVFRSGKVRINGVDVVSTPGEVPTLSTTNRNLIQPKPNVPMPAPLTSPQPSWFVGIDFDTMEIANPTRLLEILFDGALDAPVAGENGPFNLALWDITDDPFTVATWDETMSPRNVRTSVPVQVILEAQRRFRLVARATQYRPTPLSGPQFVGGIMTRGGVFYGDEEPTSGVAVKTAPVDRESIYLAIRTRPAVVDAWSDLGGAVPGITGEPELTGSGIVGGGATFTLNLTNAAPGAGVVLIAADAMACVPFAGGALMPSPQIILPGLQTDANGDLAYSQVVTAQPLSGTPFICQLWIADPQAPVGLSASNAIWTSSR